METLQRWRANRTLAYVVPLIAFTAMLMLVELFKVDNQALAWHKHSPELWIYPLQCVVCGALLVFWWRHYIFKPMRGFGFATLMGLLGIGVWIAPTFLFDLWGWETDSTAKWLELLGFQERQESGFDPSFLGEHTAVYWASILARFLRMVMIVAFVEEIFWRGFLMRYLIDMDRDFLSIPFGSFSRLSVGVTIVLFTVQHHPADWMVAVIYGSLACWVAIRTKSLAACVWMHAVANFSLGCFIMATKNWGLW